MVGGVSKDCMMVGDVVIASLDELEEVLLLQIESFGVLYMGWNLISSTRQVTGNLLSCG